MINYKTIQGSSEALYEISKSRFLCFTAHAETEAQAQNFIAQLRKTHWEARHCCSAYILGEHGILQKADDDGEPSGTAGKPLLEVLKKQHLSDVVIVVVRYFGGIKLGAGGLIRAYGKTATLGLEAAEIVTRTLFRRISVTIEYSLLGALENHLHQNEIRVEDKIYSDKVSLLLLLPMEDTEKIEQELLNLTAANCSIKEEDLVYINVPL